MALLTRHGSGLLAGLALLLLAASVPAPAVAGGTVISIDTCGQSVTKNAKLTRDLDCTSYDSADGITIDLNGHVINVYSARGVIVDGRSNVTVRNGWINALTVEDRAYARGVQIEPGSSNVTLTGLTITGFYTDMRDYRQVSTVGLGISCEDAGTVTISKVTATHLSNGLISARCSLKVSSSDFSHSTTGVYIEEDAVDTFSGVTSSNNVEHGWYAYMVHSLSIAASYADNNGWNGMWLDANGEGWVNVSTSYARGNYWYGIQVNSPYSMDTPGQSSFIGNTASSNRFQGIDIYDTGGAVAKSNVTNYNRGAGFAVINNNTSYGVFTGSNNIARFNGGPGFDATADVPGSSNKVYGNTGEFQCRYWRCVVSSK